MLWKGGHGYMLKIYYFTISKHTIFLYHTFLCWKSWIFFFFLLWFICGLGHSFVYFVLYLGLHWAFFLVVLFLSSQGLFQSLYKLCCHQEKILTFCCPLNLHNKGFNLNLVFVQWNFCLIRTKVSAATSFRVIVTRFQLCLLCLERLLDIQICRCIHCLRSSQTGQFLIGSWILFLTWFLFLLIVWSKIAS